MKLYSFPHSDNAAKVIAVMHEINADVEIHNIDLFNKEQLKPEFLKLNRNHKVPTLVDGDFVLWESNAIMQYVADKVGPSTYWPTSPRARADISRWQCWQLAHWSPPLDKIIFERCVRSAIGMGDPNGGVCTQAAEEFEPFGAVLNEQLSDKKWVTGDALTLADFSLAAPLSYMKKADLPVKDFDYIMAWYSNISSRDSWKAGFPAH